MQPPAQSRVSHGIRPGCSGLDPARTWNPQILETALSNCFTLLWGKVYWGKEKKKFLWGKVLLRSGVNCSCFFSLLSLVLPPCAILKSLAPSLWPSCRQWKKLLGPLKAIPSPGGRSPSPPSFPPRTYVPALNHSGSSWCCWLFHVSFQAARSLGSGMLLCICWARVTFT